MDIGEVFMVASHTLVTSLWVELSS
jgi:hypothetical protein